MFSGPNFDPHPFSRRDHSHQNPEAPVPPSNCGPDTAHPSDQSETDYPNGNMRLTCPPLMH